MLFLNTSLAKYCKQTGDENKEIHQPADIILYTEHQILATDFPDFTEMYVY